MGTLRDKQHRPNQQIDKHCSGVEGGNFCPYLVWGRQQVCFFFLGISLSNSRLFRKPSGAFYLGTTLVSELGQLHQLTGYDAVAYVQKEDTVGEGTGKQTCPRERPSKDDHGSVAKLVRQHRGNGT